MSHEGGEQWEPWVSKLGSGLNFLALDTIIICA